MFHFLATTKRKRQQIAILIISFFAYVAAIRNEGSNMLLQQQALLRRQQTTTESPDNNSPPTDIKQESTVNFRPSQVIDFTPADAAVPQPFKPTYIGAQHSANNVRAIQFSNNNNNIHDNVLQKQEAPAPNRRYAIETAATYGGAAEKPFAFPNEQQQIPQHLTDKPIYIYRDPFTNENYRYTPTETNAKETAAPTTHTHNNYNNDAYKQQNLHQHLPHHDDNQEYLVQSSMTVGTHHHHHNQHQHQQQQEINPLRPDMSLSADKDVYLKRPGFVYDEKPSFTRPNSAIEKTSQLNKISYDSHDYPPPSYFQQKTSNFLPTPVPKKPPTAAPTAQPIPSPYQRFRTSPPPHSAVVVQHQPHFQYAQPSQSALTNYANSVDNYLLHKQQTSELYGTDAPTPPFSQQPQIPHQFENRPPSLAHDFPQQTASPPSEHRQQYFSRPPPYSSAHIPYRQRESARPTAGRPSYNNYYDYQIGEIPPRGQTYPYPGPTPPPLPPQPPSPQYPYQGPYRPPQLSGLATLAQYAPQFTSLLLGGGGAGGSNSNSNGPLGNLIDALTGAATSQQPSSAPSPASSTRRPINSQLIKALENIARNDDLQCVPKVLCQMIGAQTQRGQLPALITSPAITNFLAGFPAASPALIYGRAALLGLSGGEKSCHQTYVNCAKDEDEIIYYLNNHRGGFFKFFGEPEEQQQTVNLDSTQQSATSLFSILSALAGAPQATTTTARPTSRPQPPATDVTSGIANFFTQLLSDYGGGATVEYQRGLNGRAKRSLDGKIKFEGQSEENTSDTINFRDESSAGEGDVFKFTDQHFGELADDQPESEEDFHDDEDEEDTQHDLDFKKGERDYVDSTQSRILHSKLGKGEGVILFPAMGRENRDEIDIDEALMKTIKKYNDYNKERKLKFPTATDDRMYTEASKDNLRKANFLDAGPFYADHNHDHQFTNYVEKAVYNFANENHNINFTNYPDKKEESKENSDILFPERQGKILNRFHYAASFVQSYAPAQQNQGAETVANDEFVLPNDQTSSHDTEGPSSSAFDIYNNPLKTQNVISSTHFLPTPPPQANDFTSTSFHYSNQNNSNNQQKQSSSWKYPSVLSTSSSHVNTNYVQKPAQPNFNRHQSSFDTTRRPQLQPAAATENSDSKNIYVTNSRGITEYYITPDGRRIYL